jgi:hypothetical protein
VDKFSKFVALSKIEEQADGSLRVYGLVTAEQPDLDGEVCDYATSAPLFRAQANRMLKITSGIDGMEPSLMPLREMHQLKAIGAGRAMDLDDATKEIRMGFDVVEADAVKKFKAGVLIGFSQGGDYVKKWPDPVFKGKTRYTADPGEVSAVDSPCLPMALVETMKGKTYEIQKASGTVEVKQFDIPAEAELRMQKLERELAAMKRTFTAEERHHDAGTGAALPDGSFPIHDAKDLENAIHDVGRASDPARAKQHIEARAKTLGITNLLPDEWKGSKKAALGGKENDMANETDAADLQKKAAIEKMKAARKAHDQVSRCLGGYCEHDETAKCAEKCEEAHGALKAAFEDGEKGSKKAATSEIVKTSDPAFAALRKSNEDLLKAVDELTKKLAKTSETAAAHTGIAADFAKATGYLPEQSSDELQSYAPPGFIDGEASEAMKKARGNLITI